MFRALPRSTALVGVTMSGLLGLGLIATADVAQAGVQTLDAPPSLTGTITLGSTGKPASGADVLLVPTDGMSPWVVTANEAGIYTFDGVEAGSYTLKTALPDEGGVDYLETFLGDTVRAPEATVFTVGTADLTKNIHAVLAAKVTGKVLLASGKPAKSAYVYAANTSRWGYSSAQTNASGVYTLNGLASGNVKIDTWTETGTRSVNVVAKQGSTVKATTLKQASPATGKITGTIKGAKNLKWRMVQAVPTKGGSEETLSVSSSGRISQSVAPGTYRVAIWGAGLRSKSIVVTKGKNTSFGSLAMPSKSTVLKGTVKLANGKPATGTYVTAVDANGMQVGGGQTTKAGAYKIPGAINGTYRIYAHAPKGSGSVVVATTASVKPGVSAVTKNIKLAGYALSGVVSYKGKPVEGALVALDGDIDRPMETDSKGRFTVGYASKGTHVISVSDPFTGGLRNKSVKLTVTKSRPGIKVTLTY